jgi:hypothetical protein
MTELSGVQVGHWFEEKVKAALVEICAEGGGVWHRFKDTRAAAQIVGNAPADFMLLHRGRPYLIECKASLKEGSFTSSLSHLADHQAASLVQWWKAGGYPWLLFYCDYDGSVEIWDGNLVGQARAGRKRLPADEFEGRVALSDLVGGLRRYVL